MYTVETMGKEVSFRVTFELLKSEFSAKQMPDSLTLQCASFIMTLVGGR